MTMTKKELQELLNLKNAEEQYINSLHNFLEIGTMRRSN